MCNERDAMATTSLVAVSEIENGFEGRGTIIGKELRFPPRWIWSVESQEAETMRLCSRLYTTLHTGASWVLSTVCSAVLRSILIKLVSYTNRDLSVVTDNAQWKETHFLTSQSNAAV